MSLAVRPADLSLSKPPRWVWVDRIALASLNLIVGIEGAGKGTLACWVFAKLTLGELPGSLYGTPTNVGVIGDEDSWNDVWVPRLHAAGADLDRVKQIERPDGSLIELASDKDRLARTVSEQKTPLLYLDALTDHLGAAVDDWRAKQVREALAPARQLARELQCAVLGSVHPNKSGGTFRQVVSGSVAFNAVSRSSLLLAEHPEDADRRVLVRAKGNLSATPEAVEFDIDSYEFEANGHAFKVPQAVNFSTSDLRADDLLAKPATALAGVARTSARELIAELLADGEWHAAGEILSECESAEIHKRAAQRAADDLGIEKDKRGHPAIVYWRQRRHRGDTRTAVAPVVSVASTDSASNSRDDRSDREDRRQRDDVGVTSANGHSDRLDLDWAEAVRAEHGEVA